MHSSKLIVNVCIIQEDIPRFRYEILHELSAGIILPCTHKDPQNTIVKLLNKNDIMANKIDQTNKQTSLSNNLPSAKLKLSLPKRLSSNWNKAPMKITASISSISDNAQEKSTPAPEPSPKQSSTPANYLPMLIPTEYSLNNMHKESTLAPSTCTPTNFSIPKKQLLHTQKSKDKSTCISECIICHSTYGTKYNLLKYMRIKHPAYTVSNGNIKCQEDKCDFSCRIIQQLWHHLQEKHQKKMEIEQLTFDSMEGE